MNETTDTAIPVLLLGEAGSDPIGDRLRETVRATIEAVFDEELAAYLGRIRYGRGGAARKGYRHGRRERQLVGAATSDGRPAPCCRPARSPWASDRWRHHGSLLEPELDPLVGVTRGGLGQAGGEPPF